MTARDRNPARENPYAFAVAIAHSCHACGGCLTHIRAGLDPALGLQVVTCPKCQTSVVRRRPSFDVFRRRVLLVRKAASTLVLNIWVLTTLGLVNVLAFTSLEDVLSDFGLLELVQRPAMFFEPDFQEHWRSVGGSPVAVCAALTASGLGFAGGVFLSHIRFRPGIWGLLIGVVLLGLAIVPVVRTIGFLIWPTGEHAGTVIALYFQRPLRAAILFFVFLPMFALLGALASRRVLVWVRRAPQRRFSRMRSRILKRKLAR